MPKRIKYPIVNINGKKIEPLPVDIGLCIPEPTLIINRSDLKNEEIEEREISSIFKKEIVYMMIEKLINSKLEIEIKHKDTNVELNCYYLSTTSNLTNNFLNITLKGYLDQPESISTKV